MSQTQGNLLSAETDILRAQQELNRADRDIAALKNDFQTELAAELQQTKQVLRIANIRMTLARDLMANSLSYGTMIIPQVNSDFEIIYTIIRDHNGKAVEISATEVQAIEPGDVVKVETRIIETEMSSN